MFTLNWAKAQKAYAANVHKTNAQRVGETIAALRRNRANAPCPCECSTGGFCGGCGHAGCSRRRAA